MNGADDFDSPSGDDADSIWLNGLFDLARAPGTAEELSSEPHVVAAMLTTIAQPPVLVDLDAKRRHSLSKTAARTAIAAAALLIGTSTAAATGNLPDAAQSALSRAGSHIGVDIPDPYEQRDDNHDTASTTTDSTTESLVPTSTSLTMLDAPSATVPVSEVRPTSATSSTSSTSNSAEPAESASTESADDQQPTSTGPAEPGPDLTGPDLTGPAKQGLCRAWAAHGDDSPANQNSTAMTNLQTAAAAAGQSIAVFCADSLLPESTQVVTTESVAAPTTSVADERGQGNVGNANKDGGEDENRNSEKDTQVKSPKGDE